MKKLFLLMIVLMGSFVIGQTFPKAVGFGAKWNFTTNYEIRVVTNLNNSGVGSLRNAVESSTTHTGVIVVFNGLSGTITLSSVINFTRNNNLYIAGQTSENGIILKGSDYNGALLRLVDTGGIIVRGLTFLRGSAPVNDAENVDCISLGGGINNAIIDHCTFAWSTDELFQIWGGGENITIQNCIFAEALAHSTHPGYPDGHSAGLIFGTDDGTNLPNRISVYHNAFIHNNIRNPVMYGTGEEIEIVSNVIFNPASFGIQIERSVMTPQENYPKKYNLINNHLIDGVNTSTYFQAGISSRNEATENKIYVKGNITHWSTASDPEWNAITGYNTRLPATASQHSLTPFDYPLKNESINTTSELKNILIDKIGTFSRNLFEIRVLNLLDTETGNQIDDPSEVGGFPTIAAGTIIIDTNKNGIPDNLEVTWGNDTFGYVNSIVSSMDTSTGSITANAGENVSICSGESATLTASGGSSYSWTTGATTQSITVSPNATTIYTVTVSEGSATDIDDVIVTVNNVLANAGSDQTIFEGENITLTASGGDSFLWSTGATTKSITVSPQETQNYILTVYMNGCVDTDTVQVTVNKNDTSPPPAKANAGKDQTICLGESIILTANGGSTYVWSTRETSKSIQVNPTRTTNYTVTATRGGVTNSDSVIITVENCLAISETIQKEELNVYPNPTTSSFHIEADNEYDYLNLNIYSMNGSIVYSDIVKTNNNIAYKIVNLSYLNKGIYIISMYNADYHKTRRILLY